MKYFNLISDCSENGLLVLSQTFKDYVITRKLLSYLQSRQW